MKKRIKIHGFIIFLSIIIIAIFPDVFLRFSADLTDYILTNIGMGFVLLGQIFRLSSRGYKAEQSKNGAVLVVGGPYSLVRNPMYLGIILIGLGLVIMLFKWWAICIFLVFFTLIYIKLIFQEEKRLIQLFPGVYEEYRKKIPAILPSLRMLSRTEISSYLPLKLSWLKKEVGSISSVLIFAILVKSWESFKSGENCFYFYKLITLLVIIISAAILAAYLIKRSNAKAKSI